MEVIYLYHSGFAVALHDFLLVFDYVGDQGKGSGSFPFML